MPNLLDALSDSENTIDLQDENLITPIHEFLEINPEKRLITIPESEQLFGVYGENKVEIKYFKCPRIILNDIDLYECYIFINYISASGKIGYIQADTVVLDETESYIIFTWELTRNVFDENIDTDIYFSISAKQYLEDKEPVFFTRKAKGNLYETVYAEEQITEQYADIILQLLAEMDGVKQIATPEAMQEYVNIWLSENPDKLGGQPIPVKSANEMLNTNTIYLYMGVGETINEVVYEKGYIYYYSEEEQSWIKGSFYGGKGENSSFGGSAEDVTYDDTETKLGVENVQDAIGKLSEQIGASSWNDLTDKPFYSEYEEAELFSERTFTTADLNPDLGGLIIEDFPQLVDGDTYVVNFNGVDYSCAYTGQVEEDGTSSMGLLGNALIAGVEGVEDTGEPFIFGVDENGSLFGTPIVMLITMDMIDGSMTESTTWTFSIKGVVEIVHKIDNKYVDSDFIFERTVVEETICKNTRVLNNNMTTIYSGEMGIENELGVSVTIDSVEYKRVWTKTENDFVAGNMSLAGIGEDTGEPFCLSYHMNANDGIYYLQFYMTGYEADNAYVTIASQIASYNKIPYEYLPNILKLAGRRYGLDSFEDVEDAYKFFKSGSNIENSKQFILAIAKIGEKPPYYANLWVNSSGNKLYYARQTLFSDEYEIPMLMKTQTFPKIKISEFSVGSSLRVKEKDAQGNITWEAFDPSELSGNVDLTGYVKTEDLEQEVLSQLEGVKADIAQQVIDAFNGLPLFGTVDADNNIKISSMLADGEYTLVYENSDGTTTELGTFIVDGESGADSNNLIASSVDSDGQPYNSGLGYKNDYRLNSSGVEASASGKAVTGFIPVTVGKKLYGANLGWDNTDPTSNYFALYDESFTKLQSVNETNMRSFGGTFDINNGGFQIYVQDSYGGVSTSNAKYVRISGTGSGANFILSNEAIE